MRSVTLNTQSEGRWGEACPDSAAERHAFMWGRPASPPQVARLNICPPPLGCLDTSSQSPPHHSPVFRSGDSWHGQPGQAARLATKSFSWLPEVTQVQKPGKNGLCIFKTSGPSFGESHAHRGRKRRGGGGKEHCQMVFVLPNDLQKETLRTRGAVSVDVSHLVFHIHYRFSTLAWRGF